MGEDQDKTIQAGMWAKVRVVVPGEEDREDVFHFVSRYQADVLRNMVPIGSPFGRALSGSKSGDEARLDTKKGTMQLTVVDVGDDRDD